tara:strand:+ start:352 stop:678 length:327 start_codon:yes stop_codon:yes gene_type:complete
MIKLLIDAPTGLQEIVEVGKGGGYYDASRVLWDERDDGELPDITLGGMTRKGKKLVFDQVRKDEHDSVGVPLKNININELTRPEMVKLIDLLKTSGVISAARATKIKG